MKYYKDSNNEVYAFPLDGSQDAFIPEGLVQITEEEADELRNFIPIEQRWAVRLAEIQALLDQSDLTILRCYENGVPVPPEWVEYRAQLRALLKITDGNQDNPLPERPPYPEGS